MPVETSTMLSSVGALKEAFVQSNENTAHPGDIADQSLHKSDK